MKRELTVTEALMVILDEVDYVRGHCSSTEMVGAVLPREIIAEARAALARERGKPQ